MKQEIITCDTCGRDINIPNEEEHTVTAQSLNGENIVFSNRPSFLHLSILGHGKLYANIQTEIDICWQCIVEKFVIKNRSRTEKGVGKICFTTGARTDLGMMEIYTK